MAAPTNNKPLLSDGEYTVKEVNELNFFDLSGERAKIKGTSNKQYRLELQVSKDGSKAQIFSMYGATGSSLRKDWRHYGSVEAAKKDYDSILKSKRKKGYKDIDVALRAYGSVEAKSITKAVELKNTEHLNIPKSTLHKETQRLISELFGSTNQFVIQTLKCPLGQLTNNQIDLGKACLNKAKNIVSSGPIGKREQSQLIDITNEFYTLIPHHLGSGARGKMTELLLDNVQKIAKKEDDLDTLLDAKSVGAVITGDSGIDSQYKALNADFDYIDKDSDLFKWIVDMVIDTRASNHRNFGNIKVLNTWSVKRNNEFDSFINKAKEISETCNKQVIPDKIKHLVPKRNDIDKYHFNTYRNANILPLFHGTRTQNIVGITKSGLLIRPSGAVLTGAMYGSAVYTSCNSTKSINYTSIKSSYWASGGDNKGYLFLVDSICGNQKIVSSSGNYTKNSIKPHHSVWAKGGYSGVINDEIMLYDSEQIMLRYLIEFECKG